MPLAPFLPVLKVLSYRTPSFARLLHSCHYVACRLDRLYPLLSRASGHLSVTVSGAQTPHRAPHIAVWHRLTMM